MNTERITCNCKVHKGAQADVPATMLVGANRETVVHNLVGVAWSPLGGLGNLSQVRKVVR